MSFLRYFLIFLFLGSSILTRNNLSLITIPITMVGAAIYFIYYLYISGAVKQIILGIVKSIFIMFFLIIPIVGWIIVISFIIYNIKKSLSTLKLLIPDLIFSALIYSTLWGSLLLRTNHSDWYYFTASIFFILSAIYSWKISHLPPQTGYFRISFLLISIPIFFIIIRSIIQSIANIVQISARSVTSSVISPQTVSAHIRNGIPIAAYTRNISQEVTNTVTNVSLGSGIVTSAILKENTEILDKKIKESKNEIST